MFIISCSTLRLSVELLTFSMKSLANNPLSIVTSRVFSATLLEMCASSVESDPDEYASSTFLSFNAFFTQPLLVARVTS